MANIGVAPLDPSSLVGVVRLNVGDTNYVPLDPPVAGQGVFDYYSDAQLSAFLTAGNDSPTRATGTAIKQMALTAALSGRSVKTDDLAIDSRQRGTDLLAIAQSWLDQADAEDALYVAGIFDVIKPAPHRDPMWREPFGFNRFDLNPVREAEQRFVTPEEAGLTEDPNNPGFFLP